MSRHVAPHELADLHRGRLQGTKASRARAHVAECDSCTAVVKRLAVGIEAMVQVGAADAPDLGWDHIGARVYWSTSSERRAKERGPSKYGGATRWAIGGGLGALAAAALYMWVLPAVESKPSVGLAASAKQPGSVSDLPGIPTASGTGDTLPTDTLPTDTLPTDTLPTQPTQILGVVVLAEGEIQMGHGAFSMDTPASAGSEYVTNDGRLVIQFGESSAFRLAPHSRLKIDRLDSARIALRVEGQVDVDITRRAPGQEFVVAAGSHEVQVRGTAFRVQYIDGNLGVQCLRGKVVVTDGGPAVNVSAGQRFEILRDALGASALRALPINGPALEALGQAMQMPMLAAWNPNVPTSATAVLEVGNVSGDPIAVDGTYIGSGTFALRTSEGEHEVSLVDPDGDVVRGRVWNAAAGTRTRAQPAEPSKPARAQRAARKRQLVTAVSSSPRTEQCLVQLKKRRLLSGSYLSLEVGVNHDGSQSFLNVLDSNLHPSIQTCLRDVIDDQQLPQGSATSFRFRLSY